MLTKIRVLRTDISATTSVMPDLILVSCLYIPTLFNSLRMYIEYVLRISDAPKEIDKNRESMVIGLKDSDITNLKGTLRKPIVKHAHCPLPMWSAAVKTVTI